MSQPWSQRALSLLAAAWADEKLSGQVEHLSVGQRDACLLTLREQTFGPQLTAVTPCPACGELLEFGINAADIRATPALEQGGTIDLSHAGYDVRFRLPNSLDLASLDPNAGNLTNRQRLLARCVVTAQRAGSEIAPAELPEDVVAAVARRMEDADPQADVRFALTCPKCAHAWQATLDILSFFWSEIHAWAVRLLHDVHVLASAYSWRETDILAMSPMRRQAYLEMIQQ